MNYELAKELKDAGFPQEHTLLVYYEVQTGDNPPHHVLRIRRLIDGYTPHEILGYVAALTLSELIGACGEKFHSLEYIIDGGIDGEERLWWASSRQSIVPEAHQQAGITPEEAIAHLWLALNKK